MESLEPKSSLKTFQIDTNIKLTDKEQEIFNTLMEVVRENNLKTTLRVAGGWVRDKVSDNLRLYSEFDGRSWASKAWISISL